MGYYEEKAFSEGKDLEFVKGSLIGKSGQERVWRVEFRATSDCLVPSPETWIVEGSREARFLGITSIPWNAESKTFQDVAKTRDGCGKHKAILSLKLSRGDVSHIDIILGGACRINFMGASVDAEPEEWN